MNPKIKQKIKELGKVLDLEIIGTTIGLYAPLLAKSKRNNVKVTRNISYGPHECQKLDIYQPEQEMGQSMPILVFVHGGGFVMGNKSEYRNIGYYFARHGILTIIPSYRLAPEFMWPSGARDVADVIKLIRQKGDGFGGNTDPLVLMGHSAGAAHVASYLFGENFENRKESGVAGGVLMSCPVLDPENVSESERVYYGQDASMYRRMSVLNHIKKDPMPILIMTAEYDPPVFDEAALKLINALWKKNKNLPFFKKIIHHNHVSEVMQFNTNDSLVGPDLLNFIRYCTPAQSE